VNLIEAIKAVPDYRQARGIRHQLWLILTIVLYGIFADYKLNKPIKLARSKTIGKAVKKIFYELVDAINE
jgi:hypothetical protein